jgi:hypothetical protein
MTIVAKYPDSTKASLEQRLAARARERWPQIASLRCGSRLRLAGQIGIENGRPVMINPAYELLAAGEQP